jgi:hypothetical protein
MPVECRTRIEHYGNDRDCDTSSYQPEFNGCRASVVLQKLLEHGPTPLMWHIVVPEEQGRSGLNNSLLGKLFLSSLTSSEPAVLIFSQ